MIALTLSRATFEIVNELLLIPICQYTQGSTLDICVPICSLTTGLGYPMRACTNEYLWDIASIDLPILFSKQLGFSSLALGDITARF